MPRIIAGEKRGMRLNTLKGDLTRPTGDKAKEALFSILANRLAQSRWLDLFAGSGQIGLEALSRGAAHAVFVEPNRQARHVLCENIKTVGYAETATVLAQPALRACERCIATGERFDFIYVDPPWPSAAKLLDALAPHLHLLLQPDGWLIVERAKTAEKTMSPANMIPLRDCRYGGAVLSFYAKSEGSDA